MQILLDEGRYARLDRQARKRGTSIAVLVREAIDATYPADEMTRAQAAADFLARPPIDLPDWPELKAEIEDAMLRGLE